MLSVKFSCISTGRQLFTGSQTNVRDNRLKPQPIVKTAVLYEEQIIALRSNRHDATHFNTDENHGDVVLETMSDGRFPCVMGDGAGHQL